MLLVWFSFRYGYLTQVIFVMISSNMVATEAVSRRCTVKKKCSYKFRKIHRKTPVPESPGGVP